MGGFSKTFSLAACGQDAIGEPGLRPYCCSSICAIGSSPFTILVADSSVRLLFRRRISSKTCMIMQIAPRRNFALRYYRVSQEWQWFAVEFYEIERQERRKKPVWTDTFARLLSSKLVFHAKVRVLLNRFYRCRSLLDEDFAVDPPRHSSDEGR